MLPEELLAPPPRDVSLAVGLMRTNALLFKGMLVAGGLVPAIVILRAWFKYGPDSVLRAVPLAVGLMVLVSLVAVAVGSISNRSLRLYRDGIATMGTVYMTQSPAGPGDNDDRIINVQFQDLTGRTRSAQVAAKGIPAGIGLEGEVAVLYLPDKPRMFAVYKQGEGLVSGTVLD